MNKKLNNIIDIKDIQNKVQNLMNKSVNNILGIGKIFYEVKQELKDKTGDNWNKNWKDLFKNNTFTMSFGNADKYIAIYKDKNIKKYKEYLPLSYNTIYQLRDMTEEQWQHLIKSGMNNTSTAQEIVDMKLSGSTLWIGGIGNQALLKDDWKESVINNAKSKGNTGVKVSKKISRYIKSCKISKDNIVSEVRFGINNLDELSKKDLNKVRVQMNEISKLLLNIQNNNQTVKFSFFQQTSNLSELNKTKLKKVA